MIMAKKVPLYMENIKLNSNFNHKDELDYWLKKFNIQKDEICLYGSVPLHITGIRENRDVDFITTDEIIKRITSEVKKYPNCKIDTRVFFGDNIHSGPIYSDKLSYAGLSNRELIYNDKYHMLIDGYKIFRLELTFATKNAEKRNKDLEDIKKIEQSGLIGRPGWDWDLVFSLPPWDLSKIQKSIFIFKRIKNILKTQKIKKSLITTLNYYSKTENMVDIIDNFFLSYYRFKQIKNIYFFQNFNKHLELKLPIPVILSNYNREDKFYGWDIILEYVLKSRNLTHKKNTNLNEKMVKFNDIKNDYHSPIILSKNGIILKGRSTFVNEIIEGKYIVNIQIENTTKNIMKKKDWLKENKLTDRQNNLLKNKSIDVFERTGLIFYAMIWPSAYEIFNDIEEYVRKRVKVLDSKKYDISHNFSNIVKELYEQDPRAIDWKIERKIHGMQRQKEVINVLKLWLPNPKFRYNIENSVFSEILRKLKNDCRKKYSSKIDNYFWDNIIHITENYEHNYHTFKVLSKI